MKRLLPLFVVIAAACSSTPNQPATAPTTLTIGSYSADMGPSPVGVIPAATLHDAQRNKDVEVSIEYPTRGSSFPVIVFSHGYGSSDHGYEPLISYWTSNGYVCIRPSHADAGLLRETPRESPPMQPSGQSRRRGTPQQQGQIIPLQQNNPMEQIWDREREPQWQNRVADVKLVLDSLDDLERRFPELQGKMDRRKIGVGGHSYGAFTALLIAGMNASFTDPRVRAVVAMSPPGPSSERGITAQSFATIKIPAMFMTGTNDRGANESEDANWRKQAFDDSPSGDKYLVLIDGARHSSFTGRIGFFDSTPMNVPRTTTDAYGRPVQVPEQQTRGATVFGNDRRIFQIIKTTSTAFWDAYLKGDSTAHELLQQQKYETALAGAHLSAK